MARPSVRTPQRFTRVTVLVFAAAVLTLLAAPAGAGATPAWGGVDPGPATAQDYHDAIARLIAEGYPQAIVDHLCALGTRCAGSPADDAGANYIADQLAAMGLGDVRLEPVPVDEYWIDAVGVTVLGVGDGGVDVALPASTWMHMQPTPAGGITAPVVYAGRGTAQDFDALGEGAVEGKLALIDAAFGSWYPYYPWAEATLRGAVGVITTGTPDDTTFWSAPDALGMFPAYYDLTMAPAVWVSPRSGDWLKGHLADGPVEATITVESGFRMAEDGGEGYNVVAEIPGAVHPDEMVVWSGHHDAFWEGALDDTSAVAQMLTVAKAMMESGYAPERTWVFLFTTAEEGSRAETYYDWLYGAWWAITQAHPDWPGRVTGQINLEMQGGQGELWVNCNCELRNVMRRTLNSHPELRPYGYTIDDEATSWNDQFPFIASGVPALTFSATSAEYDSTIYHTPADTPDLIDWEHFGLMNELEFRMAQRFDRGLLPYDLAVRGAEIEARTNTNALLAAGADTETVAQLDADIRAFQRATKAYRARANRFTPEAHDRINAGLLAVEKEILAAFTALDVWEYTVYPHEQVQLDVASLQKAIAELERPQPSPTRATGALEYVSQNWYGPNFSPEVYAWELTRHQPDSPILYFGSLGKIAYLWNVMPQYRQIEAGEYAAAHDALVPMYDGALTDLNERLAGIGEVLESVTPQVRELR